MIYPSHFESKIGFDKIKIFLKEKCISSLGEEKVDDIRFSSDINTISTLVSQTQEFINLISENDSFPTDAYFDIRSYLSRIKIEGSFLTENELFEIQRSLLTIKEIVAFINNKEDKLYPELKALSKDILLFPPILQRIDTILNKFGKIKDNASPELARIRKEKLVTASSISRILDHIIRKAQAEGYTEKDITPSVREGRLVIPVIPAFKRKINGIVHDESASGKTIYIEPAEVVEANNQISELKIQEKREITKILTAFTDFVRPYIPELLHSYDFLGTIDFIRAKALFSIEIGGIKPVIEDNTIIDWINSYHPLLYLSLKKQQKNIIPLTILLTNEHRLLLISGPNAGGKSVCLKTVGLLQYMMQCGLPVPMKENSTMGIFEHIFIDIGDEQSIENDLSTYSSHLSNMKFFIKNSNEKTLILIDEFGSGTEPQIGGAIAEAELNVFNQNKTFGVITTHYTNLKHFASQTDGIINGAMLYDRHLMQPLFQLKIGNPGSSFAIEIARKIGLPESIISEATEKIGLDHINYDKNLQDIARDKHYWENKRQQIRLKEKKLEEISEQLRSELESIDKQRKIIIREAKSEANLLLSNTNATIENTIRQIKESNADKEKARLSRKNIEELKTLINTENSGENVISKKIEKLQPKIKREILKEKEETVKVGDYVRLKGHSTFGSIIKIQQKTATVAFGDIKSTVKLETLEKVSHKQVKQEKRQISFVSRYTNDDIRERKLNFKQEIDVRGLRAEEALQTVSFYIDNAFIVNASTVRILHGTGTGALRQAIRHYLSTIPGIKSAKDEHIQLGGAGITVVEFE